MAGFKNAPEITEFAVGMRFTWRPGNSPDVNWEVVAVTSKGDAICGSPGLTDSACAPFRVSDIERLGLELHLDSIWVGRKYRRIKERVIHTVESLGRQYLVMLDQDGVDYSWPLVLFSKNYEPLPLPGPEPPVKVEFNDEVRLVNKKDPHDFVYGRVTNFKDGHMTVESWAGRCFSYDVNTVIITKLVPQETKP